MTDQASLDAATAAAQEEANLRATQTFSDEDIDDEDNDPMQSSSGRDSGGESTHEARLAGWKPKDEWTGDPALWVDADTFVKRGEKMASRYRARLESLEKEISGLRDTNKKVQVFYEEKLTQRDKDLEVAITNLRRQKVEATREGDDDSVIQIEDRLEQLRDERKTVKKELDQHKAAAPEGEAPARGPDMNHPVIQEWIGEGNEWFRDDPKLRAYAISVGEDLTRDGSTLKGRAFLEKVAEQVRADFPRRFPGNQASSAAMTTSGSTRAAATPVSGKSFRELSPSDRALAKQFIRDGLFADEAAFLKAYNR